MHSPLQRNLIPNLPEAGFVGPYPPADAGQIVGAAAAPSHRQHQVANIAPHGGRTKIRRLAQGSGQFHKIQVVPVVEIDFPCENGYYKLCAVTTLIIEGAQFSGDMDARRLAELRRAEQ